MDTRSVFGRNERGNRQLRVYTETTPVNGSLVYQTGSEPGFEYGPMRAVSLEQPDAGDSAPPSEGSACWSFDVAAGSWFGMGVFLPNFRNLNNYSDGYLHFDIRTAGRVLKVGIKTCRAENSGCRWGGPDSGVRFCPRRPMACAENPAEPVCQHRFPHRQPDVHDCGRRAVIGDEPVAGQCLVGTQRGPAGSRNGISPFSPRRRRTRRRGIHAGVDGNFFIWENTLVGATQNPYEGTHDISLQSAPGMTWFGAAFTPNVKYNLAAFGNPGAKLRFSLKTSSAPRSPSA